MPRPQTSQRKLSQIASKPQNSRRFSPSKVSRYTALTSERRYSWSKFTASGHLCSTCCKFSLALLRQLHSNPCFTIPALTWQMVSEVCTCMLTLLCITSSCHVRMHCQLQDMLLQYRGTDSHTPRVWPVRLCLLLVWFPDISCMGGVRKGREGSGI